MGQCQECQHNFAVERTRFARRSPLRWADEQRSGRLGGVEFGRRAEIEGLPRDDNRELPGGGADR